MILMLFCTLTICLIQSSEEIAKNYKLKDKLKVKILEIKKEAQNRVGLKQTQKDPFDFFNTKKLMTQLLQKYFLQIISINCSTADLRLICN